MDTDANRRRHLLIVEDERALREAIATQLADNGYVVDQADSGELALERLAEFAYDIIITDLRLPGMDGTSLLEAARSLYPDIVGIVITGYGTVKDAVEAIKRGATDFVTKPFQLDALLHILDTAVEQRQLKAENAYLRSQLEERYRFEGIVGRSRVMKNLFHLLETVATTSSTVLITGETGTGKELVAQAIHHNSLRRNHRFVALNCSAIPETLQEAELFGHVRGAFTGAVATRAGRLEQAHRGTLFLDEVGTMSPALQMKLLRVLQEREFERVGDTHSIKVDVRVIGATNSDLAAMMKAGRFREDLYYRLNVIPIQMPPLREHKEDIPLLVTHFLSRLAREMPPREDRRGGSITEAAARGQQTAITVSQQAMRRLMSYGWPGNVRQLENALERAVALGGGRSQIEVADLPPEIQGIEEGTVFHDDVLTEMGLDLETYLGRIERDLIRRSLELSRGNKGQAARLLNLKRTTLVEKLKRLERGGVFGQQN
jgi:two-component system, NtrC family, response regulator AtoC